MALLLDAQEIMGGRPASGGVEYIIVSSGLLLCRVLWCVGVFRELPWMVWLVCSTFRVCFAFLPVWCANDQFGRVFIVT